jgi:1-acyl-sn-glycerol-3-phosphate acyltransferase
VDVRRKPWFLALARRYVRRRFRREFDGFHVEGLERIRALVAREPVIVASTHVAWWDALFAIQMDWLLGTETYCLMDADNLKRLPFFGWVGAVPLDRSSPKRALKDMKAAATLLDRPGRVLWIFPQGRQRPAHLRPLDLQPGVRWLARTSGARTVPLALNYLFREGPAPAVVSSFGEPIGAREDLVSRLDAELRGGLDRIDRFVDAAEGAFEEQLLGASDQVPLAGRLLSKLGEQS